MYFVYTVARAIAGTCINYLDRSTVPTGKGPAEEDGPSIIVFGIRRLLPRGS